MVVATIANAPALPSIYLTTPCLVEEAYRKTVKITKFLHAKWKQSKQDSQTRARVYQKPTAADSKTLLLDHSRRQTYSSTALNQPEGEKDKKIMYVVAL